MSLFSRAKEFLADMFYEDAVAESSPFVKEETIDNELSVETVQPTDGIATKESFPMEQVFRDYLEGKEPQPLPLAVLGEEQKEAERDRMFRICKRVAETNGLEPAAVWTTANGRTRIKKELFGSGEKDGVLFNASYTSVLSDEEAAFIAGKAIAAIYCKHEEEAELLRRSFAMSGLTQEYRFRLAGALSRSQEYESDRIGMALAEKAGFVRPVDFSFLAGDRSGFERHKSLLDVLAADVSVAERAMVLYNTGADEISFDKEKYAKRIARMTNVVERQEKFIEEHTWKDGQYKGLYLSEQEIVSTLAYKTEKEVLSHVAPILEAQAEAMRGWAVSAIPGNGVSPRKVRELDFGRDTGQNYPEREAFISRTKALVNSLAAQLGQSRGDTGMGIKGAGRRSRTGTQERNGRMRCGVRRAWQNLQVNDSRLKSGACKSELHRC